MKVKIIFKDNKPKELHKLYLEFVRFLQGEYPLKQNLTIEFLNERIGEMTTGSRHVDHILKVLTKGRMNRDILRTLAHEWIHEYQMTILGRKRGPDIGGKNEDEANAFSARLIKMFEKRFPNREELMYESKKVSPKRYP
jgi:hypothetical protein